MKLEDLTSIGIDKESAEKVLSLHKEELKGFIPKTRFDEVNSAKANAEELVKTQKAQLEDLQKNNKDNTELQTQIEKLNTDLETKQSEYEKQINDMKIQHFAENALNNEQAKNIKAVLPFLDLTDAKLNDKGEVEGLLDKIKALKEGEETSFLFGENTQQTPAGLKSPEPKPSASGGNAQPKTYADFAKMFE